MGHPHLLSVGVKHMGTAGAADVQVFHAGRRFACTVLPSCVCACPARCAVLLTLWSPPPQHKDLTSSASRHSTFVATALMDYRPPHVRVADTMLLARSDRDSAAALLADGRTLSPSKTGAKSLKLPTTTSRRFRKFTHSGTFVRFPSSPAFPLGPPFHAACVCSVRPGLRRAGCGRVACPRTLWRRAASSPP